MSLKAKVIAGSLLCVLMIAVGVQRNIVRNARTEIDTWRGEIAPATPPPADSTSTTSAEIERLRDATRDLPGLRNEVRQLRAQTGEVQRIRAETERVLTQLATVNESIVRPAPTAEQGFVLNNTWAYAGFAAPENTIQTFFWAVRQQDLQTVVACFTPEIAKESGLVDTDTGQLRDSMREQLVKTFGNIQGFRISRAEQSADKVQLDIQAAVNGLPITVSLHHIGQEWKIYRF